MELAEAFVVEETLFPWGRSAWSCPGKLVLINDLFTDLFMIYWFIVWRMFDVFYWKTTEVAAERLSSKCLQNPAKREREREREKEGGGREKQRGARCIARDTSVHAQISRPWFFTNVFFLIPPFCVFILQFSKKKNIHTEFILWS